MSEFHIIEKNCIIAVALNKDNYSKYDSMLESFHSRSNSINYVVSNRPHYFLEKGKNYDNRDVVYLYLYEDPNTKVRDLMGYISCAASSIYVNFKGNKIVVPSVVINTFAVAEKYTVKSGYRIFDGVSNCKCSKFIMAAFLEHMNKLSYSIGITQVYLFAKQRPGIVNFYKECSFVQFRADDRVFGEPDGGHEYTLITSLENGKNRFRF